MITNKLIEQLLVKKDIEIFCENILNMFNAKENVGFRIILQLTVEDDDELVIN